MSKAQYADCSRSVSDGDLTDVEKKRNIQVQGSDVISKGLETQVFFTLPRWMSGRRKRSKIKYVKVDVPFNSHAANNCSDDNQVASKNFRNAEKSSNFLRKLFRRNSFFSSSNSKNITKTLPKVPTSPLIYASNSDVRSSSAFNFHSIDCQEYFKNKNPALCGIKNHGNTCFMNAVLQCLNNTDIFAEYFVMDHYKVDLSRRNKTHSKRYGTRGEVTEQLGVLLKSLWSGQYYASISSKFKSSVAKFGDQYEGNDQHDAQEFLLWLMDKVHEDLNIAPKEKYKKTKGNIGRSDEEIAAEMLANHLRCNSSFVQELFQGQFRSSLCCLGCGRFSNTFDPYLCVSLPISHSCNIPVFVHLVFLNEKTPMTKVGILVDSLASVSDLNEKLHSSFKITKDNLLFFEIIDGEFRRSFWDTDPVSEFKDSKGLYAVETPARSKNVSMEGEKTTLILINKVENDTGEEMFWRPFVLDISREASYKELKNEIFNSLDHVLKENFNSDTTDYFSLCIIDGKPANETICSSVDMPLYMPAIDKALLLCKGRIPHVKISINWKKCVKDMLLSEVTAFDEHPSVAALESSKKKSTDVALYECFDHYFNEERLGNEDAWVCSYCHHRLPCVKTLSLWTIPDIFIVHLKRFRQASCERLKITTFVDFPLFGLDMNPYVTPRNPNVSQAYNSSLASLAFWSPWKRSRCRSYSRLEDNMYELYAVCNHHGSMQGGHYTACCRNPVNGRWYHFDDTKVIEVQPTEVISADAYILFYQRSSLISHSCASSSSSGYSSASSTFSVGADHWAFHMSLSRDGQITSRSQDALYDVGKTASLDRRKMPHHRLSDRPLNNHSTLIPTKEEKTPVVKTVSNEDVHDVHTNKAAPKDEIPPPPPLTKHYWTVTSV